MRQLSSADQQATLEVCDELLSASSSRDISACIGGRLKTLLGYEGMAGGIAECKRDGLAPNMVLKHNFPEQYLAKVSSHGKIRPETMRFWARERKPLALDATGLPERPSPDRVCTDAHRFGFYNMLCHGQVDPGGDLISYVTFTRIEGDITERQMSIVAMTMPHLHNALVQASTETSRIFQDRTADLSWADPSEEFDTVLDLRKRQILYLIGLGKTNWEISKILGTSANNVKYHLKKINDIFETCSRSAAVAEAIRRGAMPENWPVDPQHT